MSFESFDNGHRKQKNLIMVWSAVLITLLLILIVVLETRKSYVIYKTAPAIGYDFLSRDVCYAGFNAIINRNGVSSLVVDLYIAALEKEKYSMIDFTVSKENYRLIEMESKEVCKIIVKDNLTKGHGLRSFKVKLRMSPDFIFNYKVESIAEMILDENDLRWK